MLVSFNLSANDRIGITGTTGIGKTQLMRTISGLEHVEGTMVLNGVSSTVLKWPEWRRQVSLGIARSNNTERYAKRIL